MKAGTDKDRADSAASHGTTEEGTGMYEVKGVHWRIRNGILQPPPEPRRFHTAMGMLRWALDAGMIRRGLWGTGAPGPHEMERVRIPCPGSGDWGGDWFFTPDQVAAMRAAHSRYRTVLHHLREVEPEWREVDGSRVHYADNSVMATEADKYGRTRSVTLVYPHGDLC